MLLCSPPASNTLLSSATKLGFQPRSGGFGAVFAQPVHAPACFLLDLWRGGRRGLGESKQKPEQNGNSWTWMRMRGREKRCPKSCRVSTHPRVG